MADVEINFQARDNTGPAASSATKRMRSYAKGLNIAELESRKLRLEQRLLYRELAMGRQPTDRQRAALAKLTSQIKLAKSAQHAQTAEAKKASAANTNLAAAYAKAVGALAAAGGLLRFVGDSVQLYRTQAMAVQGVTNALALQGQATSENIKRLQDHASAMQRLTGTGDEQVMAIQSLLLTYGVSVDELEKVTEATLDYSVAAGLDTTEAAKQLAKSLSGVAEETIAMVPGVKDLTKEQLKAGDAIDLVAERFEGSAVNALPRQEVAIRRLNSAWGDFKVVVGSIFIEPSAGAGGLSMIEGAAMNMEVMVGLFNDVADAARDGKQPVVAFFSALMDGPSAEDLAAQEIEARRRRAIGRGRANARSAGVAPTSGAGSADAELAGLKRRGTNRNRRGGASRTPTPTGVLAGGTRLDMLPAEQAAADAQIEIWHMAIKARIAMEDDAVVRLQMKWEEAAKDLRRKIEIAGLEGTEEAKAAMAALDQGFRAQIGKAQEDATHDMITSLVGSNKAAFFDGAGSASAESAASSKPDTSSQFAVAGINAGMQFVMGMKSIMDEAGSDPSLIFGQLLQVAAGIFSSLGMANPAFAGIGAGLSGASMLMQMFRPGGGGHTAQQREARRHL